MRLWIILLFVALCTFSGCGSNGSNNAQITKLRLVIADGGVFYNLDSIVTVNIDGKVTTFPTFQH
jgi:hypothetical protein